MYKLDLFRFYQIIENCQFLIIKQKNSPQNQEPSISLFKKQSIPCHLLPLTGLTWAFTSCHPLLYFHTDLISSSWITLIGPFYIFDSDKRFSFFKNGL